jgi:hypothetical protein
MIPIYGGGGGGKRIKKYEKIFIKLKKNKKKILKK